MGYTFVERKSSYGVDAVGDTHSGHASVHAMPWIGIASCEKGRVDALQLRVALYFPDLL